MHANESTDETVDWSDPGGKEDARPRLRQLRYYTRQTKVSVPQLSRYRSIVLHNLAADFDRLEAELVSARLPGIAGYALRIRSRIFSDSPLSPSMLVNAMFTRMKKVSLDITVSPAIESVPNRATITLWPVATLPGDHVTDALTNSRFINLFRGIYSFHLRGPGFTETWGTIDLVDKPGSEIICSADSEAKAVCEVR